MITFSLRHIEDYSGSIDKISAFFVLRGALIQSYQ